MSLDWNVAACNEEVKSEKEWPITQTIIWATVIVGMGEITPASWKEFYRRIHLAERLNGMLLIRAQRDDETGEETTENIPVTPEMIHKRIGLRCNVVYESKTKWLNRVWEGHVDKADHKIREFLKSHPEVKA